MEILIPNNLVSLSAHVQAETTKQFNAKMYYINIRMTLKLIQQNCEDIIQMIIHLRYVNILAVIK